MIFYSDIFLERSAVARQIETSFTNVKQYVVLILWGNANKRPSLLSVVDKSNPLMTERPTFTLPT